MRIHQVPNDGLLQQPHGHEQRRDVMLSMLSLTRHATRPSYLSISNGSAISSLNGTLIIHVNTETHNYKITNDKEEQITLNNNYSNNNTSTSNYDQLSREFYQSYDPSIGLHTAAVLGGILVWLVLYVIYRTRVRKCIIRLMKNILVDKDELNIQTSGNGKNFNSTNNPTMVRNLANPSIVIEASPPQSSTEYNQFNMGGQDCSSPYSLPGTVNEDGNIFQFPHLHPCGSQQKLGQSNCCPKQNNMFYHLPKSETDIPSATAQWVQNMPLAARSQQDFAGLMWSLQSHGLLAMQKPCSCPLVCPRTPQPLPLLELPNTWNKSLPVLSNSWSSQILSAYEAVINNQTGDKDLKDIINSKQKIKNHNKDEHDILERHNNAYEYLNKVNTFQKLSYQSHTVNNYHNDKNKLANLSLELPNVMKKIPDGKENPRLISSPTYITSHRPIPVTPTVMIQNSKPFHTYNRNCYSTTSVSSCSSSDIMLPQRQTPHIHISKPGYSRIPSPLLLSPDCDNRSRSHRLSWSTGEIQSYQNSKEMFRSRPASPLSCGLNQHQCSFKYQKGNSSRELSPQPLQNNTDFYHHRSLWDNSSRPNQGHTSINPLSYHNRSLSDHNYYSNLQLNSRSPTPNPQRSLSTDNEFSMNFLREQGSPTYSNESNKNSLGTSTRSHTPSPYLLQVPDPGKLFRPVTPDFGTNKYYADTSNTRNQPSMRHCVHSDSNIAYSAGQYCPTVPNGDNSNIRRYSAYPSEPEEKNISDCCDNNIRPTSSLGSSGTHNSSHNPTSDFTSQANNHQQTAHQRHHSTGRLVTNYYQGQLCGLYSNSNLNRSYSAAMMETKL